MTDLSPRLTYSPEGILELRKDHEGPDNSTLAAELVADIPGYEVIEELQDLVVRIDVERVLRDTDSSNVPWSASQQLIEDFRWFSQLDFDDPRDGVFSLDVWWQHGAKGVVYPQFQRWLNAGGLAEDAARHCIDAMAIPLGPEAVTKARNDFSYLTDGKSARAGEGGMTFGVISKRDDFGVMDYASEHARSGTVAWNWINLMTIGSCACWGVDGMERERVYIHPESPRLYEMQPHNVDTYNQSLSLVLGAAALAYYASEYQGREDILADAVWQSPRD